MSFSEVDKHINDMLTSVIACKKASLEAQGLADEAQKHYKECQYWADKLKKKAELFKEL